MIIDSRLLPREMMLRNAGGVVNEEEEAQLNDIRLRKKNRVREAGDAFEAQMTKGRERTGRCIESPRSWNQYKVSLFVPFFL